MTLALPVDYRRQDWPRLVVNGIAQNATQIDGHETRIVALESGGTGGGGGSFDLGGSGGGSTGSFDLGSSS